MIIVEGMDNSGKSTLVDKLSGDLKLLAIVNRRRPKDLQSSWDYVTRVMPLAQKFPVIMDRWQSISEPIYGPICRGSHIFDLEAINDQHHYVMEQLGYEPLIIYCRPSLDRIRNFGTRDQMAGVIDHADELVEAYDQSMSEISHRFPLISWNFEVNHYEVLRDRALSHYRFRNLV